MIKYDNCYVDVKNIVTKMNINDMFFGEKEHYSKIRDAENNGWKLIKDECELMKDGYNMEPYPCRIATLEKYFLEE